ncbi:hypothetical protein [Embleya hyalina]|uniref:DUF8175 domain-containing protein n=1 Tax=Embleya hyalina TaxID=516124 RepID=A0A401YQQ1_9ACTN|nr:hypothetical protein [Embleya hyalina]GCD96913.1 hypothetical protein EHYA_04600 [Embleya hyalina]
MKGKRSGLDTALEEERSPFMKPGFIASALLMIFVVLCVAVIAFDGYRSSPPVKGDQDSPAAVGVVVTEPPIDRAAGSAGPCPISALHDAVRPATAPSGVRWEIFRTLSLPYSVAAGPKRIQGEVARCFEHTPTGALFAVAHITARFILSPEWNSVVKYQVVSNSEVERYRMIRLGEELEAGTPAIPRSGEVTQLAGFKFVRYTGDSAEIAIARRDMQGLLIAFHQTVVWENGDWKLVLGANGTDSTSVERLNSLMDFVPWGDARR